jgi:4-carboxymuconolactone decarboxylase
MTTPERFPALSPDAMTPAQRAAAEAITAGPRKGLQGPFNAWLRSPELAGRLQKVGEYIRFETSLPRRLNEFAILITARAWTAQFEWCAHHPLALEAGLSPAVAADLAQGLRPAAMQADEAAVYDFCTELHYDRLVSQEAFDAAIAALGEQGVVDLIGACGYYALVSMTLNVAEVALPEGASPPLPVLG